MAKAQYQTVKARPAQNLKERFKPAVENRDHNECHQRINPNHDEPEAAADF
jgi:hypothetical protein